jgi:hypothetical protein
MEGAGLRRKWEPSSFWAVHTIKTSCSAKPNSSNPTIWKNQVVQKGAKNEEKE